MSNTTATRPPAPIMRDPSDQTDATANERDAQSAASAKSESREAMRARLAAMSPEDRRRASLAACARLMGLGAFRHASVVMLYMPLPSEVETTTLAIRCFQTGKIVCVPKVDWDRRDMHAVEISSFDDNMETDEHGLRTPRSGQPLPPSAIDLVVVPGLAYDTQGNRLGRGGGYYDRFLSRLRRSATSVGLSFDTQIIDAVPIDERDVSVNTVVTERRITRGRRRSRS